MSIVTVVQVSNVEDQAPAVFSNLRDDGAVLKNGQVNMNGYIYSILELQAALKAVEESTISRSSTTGDPFQW